MERRTLGRTGLRVPILGFGAATLGEEYGPIEARDGERAVHRAIDEGIDFFDVAPYYGRTLAEERLGKALEGRRDRVVLATKCCRDSVDRFDFSAAYVEVSLDASLRRLRTDHVDLLQIHDCEFGDPEQIVHETIPAARRMQERGKARFVGITGLPIGYLRDLAARAEVDTILSYARDDLLADDLEDVLVPFTRERGIGLINASPLHMGVLTPQGPQAWHCAAPEVLEAGRAIAALCERHGVHVSEFALSYVLRHANVDVTVCGMQNVAQVESSLRALANPPDPELLEAVQEIAWPVKNRLWLQGRPENDY
ncbi:MAG: aldo/keto reductase [Planctomycetes bacterium]|nr:aldo/keto reductase [Planctomycetota bacterium]